MLKRLLTWSGAPRNISSASASESGASSAAPNRAWSAASSRTGSLREACRHCGFVEQDVERRYRCVPFDKRGHRAKPAARLFVQTPDLRRDARTMVIDQQFAGGGRSGPVKLADGFPGDFEQSLLGIESVIDRIDEHVVDVEQDAAAAALREFGKERELGQL